MVLFIPPLSFFEVGWLVTDFFFLKRISYAKGKSHAISKLDGTYSMVAAGAWAGGGGGGGVGEGEKVPFAELPSAPSAPPPPPPPATAASPAGVAGVGAAAGVKRQRDEESGEFAFFLALHCWGWGLTDADEGEEMDVEDDDD